MIPSILQFISLLPFLILLFTAIVLMVIILFYRNHLMTYIITIISLILSLFSLYFVRKMLPIHIGILFYIDQYAFFYISMIIVSSLLTATLAYSYLSDYRFNKEEFYLLLLFSTLGCISLIISNHLAALFISFELISLPILGLIGYEYYQKNTLEAVIKYTILSGISSGFLLFGIALIYCISGNLSFISFSHILHVNALYDNNIILLLGFSFIIIAFAFKLSIIPFHLWTPDVYEGSEFLVLFFLSTASKIAIFSMLNKLFMHIPYTNLQPCYIILDILSFISIVFGNIMAIFQNNIKRLLAYSSISHIGFLLIAIVSLRNQTFALESMEIYLIGYLLTNISILGALSILDTQYKLNHTSSITFYRGLFWQEPILAIIITIMMLSFSGIPMSIGFIGKFYLILIVENEKLFLLGLGLILGSIVGFYYYLRIIANLYSYSPLLFRKKTLTLSQLNMSHILIYISFIMVIILGCYPELLINILQKI